MYVIDCGDCAVLGCAVGCDCGVDDVDFDGGSLCSYRLLPSASSLSLLSLLELFFGFWMSSFCLVALRMLPVMMACSRLRVMDVIHQRCSQSPWRTCGGANEM